MNLGTSLIKMETSADVPGVDTETTNKQENDPYAYLERDFSSENYKIEIKNLPKYYGISEFRKLINDKLKLASNKIKVPRRNSQFAFVCFRNGDDRDNAITAITNYKWKGKSLVAFKAKPAPDPLVKKRKDDERVGANKKMKVDDRPLEERLKSSTIPFWNVPYDEQLRIKQEEITTFLEKLGKDLLRNRDLTAWIDRQAKLHNGLPCELLNMRYLEKHDGYRNKCEFTVGLNEDNNLPTVGFRIGSYVNGTTGVGPVDDLQHIPDSMKVAVKLYQDFIRSYDMEVYNPELQSGHLRQLTIRCASDQLMIIVGVHPQNLPSERITKFKEDVVRYFSEGAGKEAKVTSMYYQAMTKKKSQETQTIEHLHGETHIFETILGLKFRISPEAFFQINSAGAEILYSSAIELAAPSENSTIVDICCGTGTIGLCFAKSCNQVLGLEITPQAIDDARANAKLNNIENSEFFAGKAEEILGSVCHMAKNDDVIGVVDPPRAGLHHRAIMQLRKVRNLNKLVYISCNPATAIKNLADLGRPESKTMHGEPFVPIKAVAVDMFPYTKHCELLIYFERWDHVRAKSGFETSLEMD